MKRYVLLVVFLFLLIPSACDSGEYTEIIHTGLSSIPEDVIEYPLIDRSELEGVSMRTEYGAYSYGVTEFKLVLENSSLYRIQFGDYCEFYIKNEEMWEYMEYDPYDKRADLFMLYGVLPGGITDLICPVGDYFGLLSAGEYRIYKSIWISETTKYYTTFTTFTINNLSLPISTPLGSVKRVLKTRKKTAALPAVQALKAMRYIKCDFFPKSVVTNEAGKHANLIINELKLSVPGMINL